MIDAVGRGAIVAKGIKYHFLHNKHTLVQSYYLKNEGNWCSRPAGFILINCKFYRNFILCKQPSDQLTADEISLKFETSV